MRSFLFCGTAGEALGINTIYCPLREDALRNLTTLLGLASQRVLGWYLIMLSRQTLGTMLLHSLLLWKLYFITMACIQVAPDIIRFDGFAATGVWLEHIFFFHAR